MSNAKILVCEVELYLPGVLSLKEKRSIIKSLLAKMRHEFNVANAEIDHLDTWQSAMIAFTAVSNSTKILQQVHQQVLDWIESRFPDAMIVKQMQEIL